MADLTPEDVAKALERLPGWSGGTDRISRTVPCLPEGLLDRVHAAEEELDHHVVVEQGVGGTALVAWTHSRGCVTDRDVELALRINALLDHPGA
ncbi:4a-hydroxytetrahydrobiopterin dehydratase [Motilibacter aurantiacus]|uniref:4a-hydroxytetrahydrobiopterin dehydratase n=1 Tax=Motilibacter aurantiacus TaxID=2714955 RepID=UPI00140D9BC2|nr:4a-hydroxytetrahydrobiopterin dehydratase [Motilibacter aurantiacus]NHC45213.1 4a-hydroxytetrahydrobiopterin dehydratase [Motilibacter aurantiacus]